MFGFLKKKKNMGGLDTDRSSGNEMTFNSL